MALGSPIARPDVEEIWFWVNLELPPPVRGPSDGSCPHENRALALVSLPIVALALARALTLAVRRRAVHATIQGGEHCIARWMVPMIGKGKNSSPDGAYDTDGQAVFKSRWAFSSIHWDDHITGMITSTNKNAKP